MSFLQSCIVHATPSLSKASFLHCYVAPVCSTLQQNLRVRVCGPPPQYDFLSETRSDTLRIVQHSFPELLDLVEHGTLVVVERPRDYVERRSDGYLEPHLVFLVGTSHMSKVSAQHVERVVQAVRPENVVVELCRSRVGIMYEKPATMSKDDIGRSHSNPLSMTGESFGAAVSRSLQLGGQSALALRLLLAQVSQKLSFATGVASGEEFRAAWKSSEDVGAQLVLGDRPIEITLKRAWEALQWLDKLKLAFTLLCGISSPSLDASEETLQALKTDSAISTMLAYFSKEFPSLLQPLIHERDRYLAWSLKRSKAVNGCSRVVGVMGQGHIRGVVYALRHDQENLRFRDLVGTENANRQKNSQSTQFIKSLAVDTVAGAIVWFVYDYLSKNMDILSIFSNN